MVSRDAPEAGSRTVTTKNAAVESNFYTITTAKGETSTAIESYLSDIESDAAAAIQRICTQGGFPPNVKDRESISRFLAFQVMRGANMRASFRHLVTHGAAMASDMNDSMAPLGAPPESFIQLRHLQILIGQAEQYVPHLSARSWRIVDFGHCSLLTADAPLAPVSRSNGPVGIGNAEWLLFPIDPVRALVFAREGEPERRIAGNRDAADYINYCIAAQAHRWIYHHPQHSPLAHLKLPPREPTVISRAGEGKKLFRRSNPVTNLKNSIIYTPFCLERPTMTPNVLAVLSPYEFLK